MNDVLRVKVSVYNTEKFSSCAVVASFNEWRKLFLEFLRERDVVTDRERACEFYETAAGCNYFPILRSAIFQFARLGKLTTVGVQT